MKQLPPEKTLDELIQLAKDFEKAAKDVADLATAIDDKWRTRLASQRQLAIQQGTQSE